MKTSPLIAQPVAVQPPAPRDDSRAGTAEGGRARRATLLLEDGTTLEGRSFGFPACTSGEVVFNTGMVGYPESLTDPSYFGQLLVCTYPLIGNYGVPARTPQRSAADAPLDGCFESWRIHARAILVADYSASYSHWDAARSLGDWLVEERIPGVTGIDTRALTKRLREKGSMLGRIIIEDGADPGLYDPNAENLGPKVSIAEPRLYPAQGSGRRGAPRIALVDCGAKHNIIRSLLARGLEVLRVPWDHDLSGEKISGILLSNGPGDPTRYDRTIGAIRGAIDRGVPTFGVCLGNQLLALAIGAKTFKLKYGHRGQNQPVIQTGTDRCFVTSQNHGFAVDEATLPSGWKPWFTNLNDRTNEGIRHESGRFRSVQFHPEAAPGPVDTAFLFDEFAAMLGG